MFSSVPSNSSSGLGGAAGQSVAWMLTAFYVGVGWLFFFYPLPVAWKFLRAMLDVF